MDIGQLDSQWSVVGVHSPQDIHDSSTSLGKLWNSSCPANREEEHVVDKSHNGEEDTCIQIQLISFAGVDNWAREECGNTHCARHDNWTNSLICIRPLTHSESCCLSFCNLYHQIKYWLMLEKPSGELVDDHVDHHSLKGSVSAFWGTEMDTGQGGVHN